jgi:putative peptidoglycan lipid II flippase
LESQNRAIEFSLFLTLPATVALVVLAQPIISVLFERGAFDTASVKATGDALAMYALGLPAYVVVKALVPGFFAREDTVTPVKIAASALLINLVLNLILMGPFMHLGIAIATAISAWCNVLALAFILKRRGYFTLDSRNLVRLPRMVVASFIMGAVIFFSVLFFNNFLIFGISVKFISVAILVFGGLIIYCSLVFLFGAVKWNELKQIYQRKAT